MADFRVTPEFVGVYETLRDELVVAVDATIVRLLDEHLTLWARRGRVVGLDGGAWVVEFRESDTDLMLYWNYLDQDLILLVLLVGRQT
jgi:spermidine synthase